MSSARSDVTGRSPSPENFDLYTSTQQADLQTFDHFPFPAGEDFSVANPNFHRHSVTDHLSNTPLASEPPYSFLGTSADEPTALTVSQDALIYSSNTANDSPTWDVTAFPDSHRSSPTLEEWTLPPSQMSSASNSPETYSPTLDGISPGFVKDFPEFAELPPYTTGDRVARKPMGPRPSKVASDLAAARRNHSLKGASLISDESLRFVGRSSLEIDNTARDHHLYQNVTVHADGLYHCPWEGKEGCQHKAEKLKCNYE
jgi:hypothetical protein